MEITRLQSYSVVFPEIEFQWSPKRQYEQSQSSYCMANIDLGALHESNT